MLYDVANAIERLRMRILVVSQYWAPEVSVPQRRWSWFCKILSEAGHEVLAIAPPPNFSRKVSFRTWHRKKLFKPARSLEFGENGEKILRTGFVPAGRSLTLRILNQATVAWGMLWAAIARRNLLKEFDAEIVVGTVPALPTAIVTRLIASLVGRPYVIDLRDAWPDLLRDWERWNEDVGKPSFREKLLSKGPAQLLIAFVEMTVGDALKRADGLILTSSFLAAEIGENRRKSGYEEIPIGVVRNVFQGMVLPEKQQRKTKLPLKVVYAGTIGRAQHLSNALYAMKIAQDDGVEVCLKLLGDGAAKPALEKLAKELGVDAEFEGKVGLERLQECYQWADTALVHLADWEPLKRAVPSKTYELMEAGIHVTAVVQGESAEIVQNQNAGIVVRPSQPELLARAWELLAQEAESLDVGARGSEWVREERNEIAPKVLLSTLSKVVDGNCCGR